MLPVACWRCEQPGHVADACDQPPARSKTEHETRIDRWIERWIAGDISLWQKRKWIETENRMWKGTKAK